MKGGKEGRGRKKRENTREEEREGGVDRPSRQAASRMMVVGRGNEGRTHQERRERGGKRKEVEEEKGR